MAETRQQLNLMMIWYHIHNNESKPEDRFSTVSHIHSTRLPLMLIYFLHYWHNNRSVNLHCVYWNQETYEHPRLCQTNHYFSIMTFRVSTKKPIKEWGYSLESQKTIRAIPILTSHYTSRPISEHTHTHSLNLAETLLPLNTNILDSVYMKSRQEWTCRRSVWTTSAVS